MNIEKNWICKVNSNEEFHIVREFLEDLEGGYFKQKHHRDNMPFNNNGITSYYIGFNDSGYVFYNIHNTHYNEQITFEEFKKRYMKSDKFKGNWSIAVTSESVGYINIVRRMQKHHNNIISLGEYIYVGIYNCTDGEISGQGDISYHNDIEIVTLEEFCDHYNIPMHTQKVQTPPDINIKMLTAKEMREIVDAKNKRLFQLTLNQVELAILTSNNDYHCSFIEKHILRDVDKLRVYLEPIGYKLTLDVDSLKNDRLTISW